MARFRLSTRSWFSCVLLLLMDKVSRSVSLQKIEAVVGDTVILPCSNSDETLQDTVNVFWRYRDIMNVYDIIDSRASFEYQEESFRGRVESFSDEWTNGNFSIELSSVKQTDEGLYTCFIPAVQTILQLTVNVKRVQQTPRLRDEGIRTEDLKNRGGGGPPENLLLFFAALLGLTLL